MGLEGVISPHDFSGYSRTTTQLLAPCPLCSASAAIETSRENLQIAGIGPVTVAYGYCGGCGHIYQVQPAPESVLADYYRKFSNYANDRLMLMPSAMTKRLLSIAKDYAGKPGRAFEVGCATGIHLVHFRAAGWEVAGCDPSPNACEGARRGRVNVQCGLEVDLLPLQRDLDLIVFSGVLEHLTDPVGALKRASSAISDTGKVLVEVPCATAPHLLPPGWFAFEHLHYFTPETLSNALAMAGLNVVEARISYRDFIYPVITVIADRHPSAYITSGDPKGAARLIANYTKRDKAFWDAAAQKLSKVDGPCFVWGAGIHTSQLFDRVPGFSDKVDYIIDRDPQKDGKTLAGKVIASPEHYLHFKPSGSLVISSYAHELEIVQDLAAQDFPEARIIRLYT